MTGTVAPRDYTAELADYLAERTPDSDFVPQILAHDLAGELRRDDPDLLAGWLMERAPQMLAAAIRGRRGQRRAALRRQHAQPFADAVRQFGEGDKTALISYMDQVTYKVDQDNTQRCLGDMTAADCRFAASSYHRDADTLAFEALFLEALARKAGDGTVREVVSDADLQRMRESIRRAFRSGVA